MAKRALERANRNYQIVATSVTAAGQLAAVSAGLAVTTMLESANLPEGTRLVQPNEGLPELPSITFLMLRGREAPSHFTDVLAEQSRLVFHT